MSKPLLFIVAFFLAVFLYPKATFAEIATVRDWIGLFQAGAGYAKTDTFPGCPGINPFEPLDIDCWVYTSSINPVCDRTPGPVPRLDRQADPCTFNNLNPTPILNEPYVFRLFAYDAETIEGLIAESNQITYNGGSVSPPAPSANGRLYHVTGDLTIDNDIEVNIPGAIFVDGNLYINTDLLALPSSGGTSNPKAGIVFIVKGTIYIKRDVEKVNAFLIAHGKDASYEDDMGEDKIACLQRTHDIIPFCSAWNPVNSICEDDLVDIINQEYLTINGSVISLNSCLTPQFVRKKTDISGNIPAETINYDPKYLIIMKDIFSRDLKIWREIQ